MMNCRNSQSGFSLIELAIVVVVFGLILATILVTLQAQRSQALQRQTENILENTRLALLGFAQSNGRLPCPASATSNGAEAPLGGGTCTKQLGFLPGVTLGIQPTDSQGYVLDSWNNRIMYAVTQSDSDSDGNSDFTTSGGVNSVGITALTPDLRVCLSATGITATKCSSGTPETNYSINNAVVVIYSLGATGSQGAGGTDESTNPSVQTSPKSVFVSHDPANTAGNEFDHKVIWISPYVYYNAIIQAGQLH